jgi:non-specific serine/threonine protein kinase
MIESIGKYRVIREVGKGATATVYQAEDPAKPGESLAIKLIPFGDKERDEGKWSRRLMKLMRTEWSVVQKLDHPNIIKIHETVIEEDRAYLVMEFIDGTTLEPFCTFDHLLPLHRTVGIIFKCAMALDYAYRMGVVHRDIKPANIMIDSQEKVKITDFGLALNISKKVETDSTFIMGVGSPSYMSPEQIKGYPLNHKTDLYSLGVVLFHLLTGRLPFRAKNPAQLIYKIINADPPQVSLLNPDVPLRMDDVIRKSLEKDLYSRYKNGAELAKDLSAVRYQILEEDYVPMDMTRFNILRKLPFFLEFEDVELWEVLRISVWRQVAESTLILREGEAEKKFAILIEGQVEVSLEGRKVWVLGSGEPVGEMAYLDDLIDAEPSKTSATVITLTSVTYLEVNPAALALASEECFEHMRQRLVATLVRRLAQANRVVAKHGELAQKASAVEHLGFELALIDDPLPGQQGSSPGARQSASRTSKVESSVRGADVTLGAAAASGVGGTARATS